MKKSIIAALAIGAGAIGTYRTMTRGWAGLIPPLPAAFLHKMEDTGLYEAYVPQPRVRLSQEAVDTVISEMEKGSFAGHDQ